MVPTAPVTSSEPSSSGATIGEGGGSSSSGGSNGGGSNGGGSSSSSGVGYTVLSTEIGHRVLVKDRDEGILIDVLANGWRKVR